MDNNQYNVFVPCYPVLLTDTWKGYRTGLQPVLLMAQDPEFWLKDIYWTRRDKISLINR